MQDTTIDDAKLHGFAVAICDAVNNCQSLAD
jgi:hypothetical protein